MKIILAYLLLSFSFINCNTSKTTMVDKTDNAETSIPNLLLGNWIEGQKTEDGMFEKARVTRAGWYSLDINEDRTVSFNGSMNCGFGEKRLGIWEYYQETESLRFEYSKSKGYMHNAEEKEISIIESYKIIELVKTGLVLEKADSTKKVLTFIRSKNTPK